MKKYRILENKISRMFYPQVRFLGFFWKFIYIMDYEAEYAQGFDTKKQCKAFIKKKKVEDFRINKLTEKGIRKVIYK